MIAIFMKVSCAIGPSNYFKPKAIWRQGLSLAGPHPEEPRTCAASRRMGRTSHGSRRAPRSALLTMRGGTSSVALEYRLDLVRKRLECPGKNPCGHPERLRDPLG